MAAVVASKRSFAAMNEDTMTTGAFPNSRQLLAQESLSEPSKSCRVSNEGMRKPSILECRARWLIDEQQFQ